MTTFGRPSRSEAVPQAPQEPGTPNGRQAGTMTRSWFRSAYGQGFSVRGNQPRLSAGHDFDFSPSRDVSGLLTRPETSATRALAGVALQNRIVTRGAPTVGGQATQRLRLADLVDVAEVDDTIDAVRFSEQAAATPHGLPRAKTINPTLLRRARENRAQAAAGTVAEKTDRAQLAMIRQKLRIGLEQYQASDRAELLTAAVEAARSIFEGLNALPLRERARLPKLFECLEQLACGETTVAASELAIQIDQIGH